jgi:hypothetical protein
MPSGSGAVDPAPLAEPRNDPWPLTVIFLTDLPAYQPNRGLGKLAWDVQRLVAGGARHPGERQRHGGDDRVTDGHQTERHELVLDRRGDRIPHGVEHPRTQHQERDAQCQARSAHRLVPTVLSYYGTDGLRDAEAPKDGGLWGLRAMGSCRPRKAATTPIGIVPPNL